MIPLNILAAFIFLRVVIVQSETLVSRNWPFIVNVYTVRVVRKGSAV